MKSIEVRLPQDFDKSFIVFKEQGDYFPCPWHYHPEYELVLVLKSTGRRMVGDHIGYFLANFNRQFKKHKKMTPSQYRKVVNMQEVA